MTIFLYKLNAFALGIVLVVVTSFRFGYQWLSEIVPIPIELSYPIVLYVVFFLGGIGVAFIPLSRRERRKLALLLAIPLTSVSLAMSVTSDFPTHHGVFMEVVQRVFLVVLPLMNVLVGVYMVLFFKEYRKEKFTNAFKACFLSLRQSIYAPAMKKDAETVKRVSLSVFLLVFVGMILFGFTGAVLAITLLMLVYLFKPLPRDVSQ